MKTQLYYYLSILISTLLLIAVVTSCNDSHIAAIDQGEMDAATIENVNALTNQEKGKLSPQEAYDAFFDMVDKVQSMQREEIENLSDREIIDLGQPILDATAGTTTLPPETLEKLNSPLQALAGNLKSISREQHRQTGREVGQIIASDRSRTDRVFGSDELRKILLNIQGGASTMSATYEDLFDQWGGYVHLYPGDNMNLANSLCPAGSMFWVHGGTYNNQRVVESKSGNFWLGVNGTVILDGLNSSPSAFTGGMANNYISWMEIQNYRDWGITSQSNQSTNITINNMTFRDIGASANGEVFFGAIYFEKERVNNEEISSHILIQNSFFNNVTHSIRFRESGGPIKILNNSAHNTGFGFFQCIECKGNGSKIRINNNSLEQSVQYGPSPLRDFISIFKSDGSSSTNRIQVNNNRARINLVNGSVNGVNDTGCFIILGDIGGIHQEAKNNIGVNPGNCGIGVAGGEQFKVENNKIYSQQINGLSNVGIYAQRYPPDPSIPCNHPPSTFSNNRSSYICGQHPNYGNPSSFGLGSNNYAYASTSVDAHYCGIFLNEIRDSLRVLLDTNLSEAIWNDW